MRACINGATTMPHPLEADLEAAAEAGFPLVEIWAGKLGPYLDRRGGAAALRAELGERGLGVAAICPYSLRLFGEWEQGLPAVERAAALAAEIGCPLLLVCPDAPGDPGRGPEVWRQAGERARTYAERAAAAGVRLAIEPLGRHAFVPGPREAMALIRAAGHPALGLMLDTFHYHKSGVPEADVAAVPPEVWSIVHINDVPAGDPAALADADRLYPGEGVLPLRETLRHFRAIGYTGAVSVEVFRRAYWDLPIAEINRRAYAGVMAALRAAGAD
jgi:2-keto-myo-inositol isomerase